MIVPLYPCSTAPTMNLTSLKTAACVACSSYTRSYWNEVLLLLLLLLPVAAPNATVSSDVRLMHLVVRLSRALLGLMRTLTVVAHWTLAGGLSALISTALLVT
jgi:hypothetical protein